MEPALDGLDRQMQIELQMVELRKEDADHLVKLAFTKQMVIWMSISNCAQLSTSGCLLTRNSAKQKQAASLVRSLRLVDH